MSDNPYDAPKADLEVTGILSGRREDLRKVAAYQKGIIVCILIYLLLVAGQLATPASVRPFLGLLAIPLMLASTVFVFLLAIQVYSTGVGIVMGLLTLVPCIGLIVLLRVNSKATGIMRENGISVGLLGARNASEI